MTEIRPYKTCIEQMHQIVEGRQELQSEKIDMKIDNMMLRIDMKIQQAITEGIDKYFGGERNKNIYLMEIAKFIVWFVGLAVAAYYIKLG